MAEEDSHLLAASSNLPLQPNYVELSKITAHLNLSDDDRPEALRQSPPTVTPSTSSSAVNVTTTPISNAGENSTNALSLFAQLITSMPGATSVADVDATALAETALATAVVAEVNADGTEEDTQRNRVKENHQEQSPLEISIGHMQLKQQEQDHLKLFLNQNGASMSSSFASTTLNSTPVERATHTVSQASNVLQALLPGLATTSDTASSSFVDM